MARAKTMSERDKSIANIERAIKRALDPANSANFSFVTEEGSWPVTIICFNPSRWGRLGLHVLFHIGDDPHVRVYKAPLREEGSALVFESPTDKSLLPVLKAERGHLETKNYPTKDGRVCTVHKWSVVSRPRVVRLATPLDVPAKTRPRLAKRSRLDV